MDRLFLGFQVKLVVSLVLSGFLAAKLVLPRVERNIIRYHEESMALPLLATAEMLADAEAKHQDLNKTLLRAQQRISTQLSLHSRGDLRLPTERAARLERGEVVAMKTEEGHMLLTLRVGNTDQVVQLGPIKRFLPLSEGRGPLMLLFVLGGLTIGIYLLLRPLRRRLGKLSQAAEAFGRGELKVRAEVDSPDAIGNVAAAFNHMAQEIERLIAAQQELLRMVSHELRTPLQRIHFALEKVRNAAGQELREDGLRRVERDLRELDTLIDELLTYVRLEHELPLQRESIDLRVLVEQVSETQAELADTVTVEVLPGPQLPNVQANPRLLRRAIGNLIDNAIRSAKARVAVRLTHDGRQILIDVEDDGPGVPIAERARILEPFQRIDVERRRGPAGCGLGLAIVRRIAAHHQGGIAVGDSQLGGARFRFTLPLSQSEDQTASA